MVQPNLFQPSYLPFMVNTSIMRQLGFHIDKVVLVTDNMCCGPRFRRRHTERARNQIARAQISSTPACISTERHHEMSSNMHANPA